VKKTNGVIRKRVGCSVAYTGLPADLEHPLSVEVRQALQAHDVIAIQYQQTQPWMLSLAAGTPIRLWWGNGTSTETIWGYVAHTTPVTQPSAGQPFKVVAVGVTWPLKAREQSVWVGLTGPDIARDIGRRRGLQVIAEDHALAFPQVLQAGRTDWEVLCDLAARIGFVVRPHGGAIEFQSRDRLIDASFKTAPVLAIGRGTAKNVGNLPGRTLYHFRPRLGDHVEGTWRAAQTVTGVDPASGAEFSATATPGGIPMHQLIPNTLFNAFPADTPYSLNSADLMAKGRAEGSRMTVAGDAVAAGDARIRPGSAVYLDGTGTTTDGFWMVDSVLHTLLAAGEYQVDLRLVTDSLGEGSPLRPTSSTVVRELRDVKSVEPVALNTPVLSLDRWRSGGRG
jgi:hypothetical protein